VVGHLGERVVLGVRIDHQHRGAVARAHQFLEDDAGQVRLARSGGGDDGQVRAGEAGRVQHDGHRPLAAAEERADVHRPHLPLRPPAQHGRQVLVGGDEDRGAGPRRHARVHKAEDVVVIAQDRRRDLVQFEGARVVAEELPDGLRRHRRIRHEGIRVQAQRGAPRDAGEDRRHTAIEPGLIVDELAVFDALLGVGRHEGELLGRLPRPLGRADGYSRHDGVLSRYPSGCTRAFQPRLSARTARRCASCGKRPRSPSMICSRRCGASGLASEVRSGTYPSATPEAPV